VYKSYPTGAQMPEVQRPPVPPSVTNAVKVMYVGAATSIIGIIIDIVTINATKSAIEKRSRGARHRGTPWRSASVEEAYLDLTGASVEYRAAHPVPADDRQQSPGGHCPCAAARRPGPRRDHLGVDQALLGSLHLLDPADRGGHPIGVSAAAAALAHQPAGGPPVDPLLPGFISLEYSVLAIGVGRAGVQHRRRSSSFRRSCPVTTSACRCLARRPGRAGRRHHPVHRGHVGPGGGGRSSGTPRAGSPRWSS